MLLFGIIEFGVQFFCLSLPGGSVRRWVGRDERKDLRFEISKSKAGLTPAIPQ